MARDDFLLDQQSNVVVVFRARRFLVIRGYGLRN